jgi:Fe-S-cluster containining protein
MASSQGISPSEARTRFTDPDPEKNPGCRTLKCIGPDRSCCLFDVLAKRCMIYSHRPRICRTFPMLDLDTKGEELICFYSDCLGTAKFVKMLREKRGDPEVQKDIESLTRPEERLQALQILLFVWLRRMMGKKEEAELICSITGVSFPLEENVFQRDCLAYFLMTITTDALDGYQYEG